jgi:hypothetical protein
MQQQQMQIQQQQQMQQQPPPPPAMLYPHSFQNILVSAPQQQQQHHHHAAVLTPIRAAIFFGGSVITTLLLLVGLYGGENILRHGRYSNVLCFVVDYGCQHHIVVVIVDSLNDMIILLAAKYPIDNAGLRKKCKSCSGHGCAQEVLECFDKNCEDCCMFLLPVARRVGV